MRRKYLFVLVLAQLPSAEWQTLVRKMAWIYRKGAVCEGDVPEDILALYGGLPTAQVWEDVVARVVEARRLGKEFTTKMRKAKRTKYMREYMRDKRRAHANVEDS